MDIACIANYYFNQGFTVVYDKYAIQMGLVDTVIGILMVEIKFLRNTTHIMIISQPHNTNRMAVDVLGHQYTSPIDLSIPNTDLVEFFNRIKIILKSLIRNVVEKFELNNNIPYQLNLQFDKCNLDVAFIKLAKLGMI